MFKYLFFIHILFPTLLFAFDIETLPYEHPNLKVEFPESCSVGDFDAMRMDFQRNTAANIILTIETFNPEAQPIFVAEVFNFHTKREDVEDGIKIPFDPNVFSFKQGTVAGVFICSVYKEPWRCLDKEYKSVAEVIGAYQAGQVKTNYQPPETTYFFNPIYIGSNGLSIPFGGLPVDKVNQVHSVFKNNFPKDLVKKVDATSQLLVSNLIDKLGSIALRIEDQAIVVSLPRYDQAKCGTNIEGVK